eukprot:scaffold50675_cov69-Attheya_sp.AAC.3
MACARCAYAPRSLLRWTVERRVSDMAYGVSGVYALVSLGRPRIVYRFLAEQSNDVASPSNAEDPDIRCALRQQRCHHQHHGCWTVGPRVGPRADLAPGIILTREGIHPLRRVVLCGLYSILNSTSTSTSNHWRHGGGVELNEVPLVMGGSNGSGFGVGW